MGDSTGWSEYNGKVPKKCVQIPLSVTSGSDPRVTRNADMRRTSEVEPDG